MNATLKMCKVRNDHFNYLHSSAFQLFQWYFFMVECCLGFTDQKTWAFLPGKSWTKSISVALVCDLPHFCADTVLLSHSSSLSAQLLLHLLVFYKGAHSRIVHDRIALKGTLDETAYCTLLQHCSSLYFYVSTCTYQGIYHTPFTSCYKNAPLLSWNILHDSKDRPKSHHLAFSCNNFQSTPLLCSIFKD